MALLRLVNCSNPLPDWARPKLPAAVRALADRGHELDCTEVLELDAGRRWSPRLRAHMLTEAFADDAVDAVFDVSGGDLANEALPHVDWDAVATHPKPYFGFSDNSCIVNSIVAMTGQSAVLWNPAAGVERGFDAVDAALAGRILRPALTGVEGLAQTRWAGGNLRCFLKLAGTRYWPDLKGKALVVESLGGSLLSLATSLAQHRQIGSFDAIAGIVVGQLTEIDEAGERAAALELVREYAGGLPIAEAPGLGHSPDSEPATFS